MPNSVEGVDVLHRFALTQCLLHLKRFPRGLQSMCSRTLRQLGPLKLGAKRIEFCLHARLLLYLRHLPSLFRSSNRGKQYEHIYMVLQYIRSMLIVGAWTAPESRLEEFKLYHRGTGRFGTARAKNRKVERTVSTSVCHVFFVLSDRAPWKHS